MKKSFISTKVISEIAIFTAIAFALDFLQGGIFRGLFPNGGSIGIAMLPILLLCYRRGFVAGLISSFCLSFLQMLGGVYAIASDWYLVFLQICLDYVLAYPAVSVAGLFFKSFQNSDNKKTKIKYLVLGTTLGGLLKLLCHYLAGVIFWASSCPDGFLGGPSGIIDGKYVEFDDEFINAYRNTGGFDIIGSGRTKLETEEQFEKSLAVCKKLNISAVVIIGGDDSNTNAAMLAEWFVKHNAGIQVIGCPKTIDGDLKNEQIEISFGFDTATKTYAELIGNIERDANSAKKYWHFVKIMGRSASHVALEAALQTQPNITLISEEVQEKKMSLSSIIDYMTDIIVKRANAGKNFGIAVIPEGLIEFIPEMGSMISNLNDIMATLESDPDFVNATTIRDKFDIVENRLEDENARVYKSLPALIKGQLLADRDPHGNVQVSKIETEKLFQQD